MAYPTIDESKAAINLAVWNLYRTKMEYKEIADAIGVHERTLYKWLAGERRAPKAVILALTYVEVLRRLEMAQNAAA